MLAGTSWVCACAAPGQVSGPAELDDAGLEWLPAAVPGTAAEALREAGRWCYGEDDEHQLDASDWWFRCGLPAVPNQGPWMLELEGLATLADVWVAGIHVLHSENMFTAHRVPLEHLQAGAELVIRCAALSPVLARRHPRPRWKSRLIRAQSLRWYRTTLLGRVPGWSRWAAPVGPWRPVRLRPQDSFDELQDLEVRAVPDQQGAGGTVSVRARLPAESPGPTRGFLLVAGQRARLKVIDDGGGVELRGECRLEQVQLWWPHTHGPQPLYAAELELDGERRPLRRVGFRRVTLDRSGGRFRTSINGRTIFCRGALWGPGDPVTLRPVAGETRAAVALVRQGGMNMLRVPGYATYEGREFWDACDELGVMVWQDCMMASYDPPADPAFLAGLDHELRQVFRDLQGRPALTVACGSCETYQQASMYGLPRARWESHVLEQHVPQLLRQLVPGVPYVPSSPSGGEPPFTPGEGVAHYFGVGAYLRPPSDARLSRVRFAAECLSFATPPERETVDAELGGATSVGHARWKQTVAQDAGTPWDFEDVRDHYVRELFKVDPLQLRYADPERALDFGRAAVAELMTAVLGEWRRSHSPCDGALILCWRDLWPGAGWGLIDALGRPKAPFYAVSRIFAPTTVVIVDEGLAGLELNLLHDRPDPVDLSLRLRVFNSVGTEVESTNCQLHLPPHSARATSAHALLEGWRDLNHVYRFTPPVYDVVAAELCDLAGEVVALSCHLPGGPARPRLPDVGLSATAACDDQGAWSVTLRSELFAHYVALDVPGFQPEDSWLHLLPRQPVTVALRSQEPGRRPAGSVRALNAATPARIEIVEP